jgi:glycosyltransferase involved in cell wall biosynthesis
MHGEVKLRKEGYRTRDGHVLEWIERLRPGLAVTVRSRPEPFPRVTLARRHGRTNSNWTWQSPQPLTLPPLRSKRRWWVESLKHEPDNVASYDRAIIWNPIAGSYLIEKGLSAERILVDLLDDWSIHVAFEPIRHELEESYARIFEAADVITANSEGTVSLAERFGHDAVLLPNGVDPERFGSAGDLRLDEGPLIVGYAGKLSERLDLELVTAVADRRPDVLFEVAGPLTAATRRADREIRVNLASRPNVHLLGDIPYDNLPELIARWDIGWVPHRIGKFEVGGDVIKTYEYRAAGLPTIITPIIGSERTPAGVTVVSNAEETTTAIDEIAAQGRRPPRLPADLPASMAWRQKTLQLLNALQL